MRMHKSRIHELESGGVLCTEEEIYIERRRQTHSGIAQESVTGLSSHCGFQRQSSSLLMKTKKKGTVKEGGRNFKTTPVIPSECGRALSWFNTSQRQKVQIVQMIPNFCMRRTRDINTIQSHNPKAKTSITLHHLPPKRRQTSQRKNNASSNDRRTRPTLLCLRLLHCAPLRCRRLILTCRCRELHNPTIRDGRRLRSRSSRGGDIKL